LKPLTSKEFDRVYKKGARTRTRYFNFIVLGGAEGKKLGIVVSKKHGSAVIRNWIKRRIKEAIKIVEEKLSTGTKVVIIPAIGVDKLAFKDISSELLFVARKARIAN